MRIKVDDRCNDCYACHEALPFLCEPGIGLEGMPHMAKGASGFLVNNHWRRVHGAQFRAAEKSCPTGAITIDER